MFSRIGDNKAYINQSNVGSKMTAGKLFVISFNKGDAISPQIEPCLYCLFYCFFIFISSPSLHPCLNVASTRDCSPQGPWKLNASDCLKEGIPATT